MRTNPTCHFFALSVAVLLISCSKGSSSSSTVPPTPPRYGHGDVVAIGNGYVGQYATELNAVLGVTSQGRVYTISGPLDYIPCDVKPSPDNRSLWVLGEQASRRVLVQIPPTGQISTLLDIGTHFSAFEIDGDGCAVFCDLVDSIQEYRPQMGSLSTLYSGMWSAKAFSIGIGLEQGRIVWGILPNWLFYSPRTGRGSARPLPQFQTPSSIDGLHADPQTGELLLTSGNVIYSLRMPGSATSARLLGLCAIPTNGMAVFGEIDHDPADDTFVIPYSGSMHAGDPRVLRFDRTTRNVTTITKFTSWRLSSGVWIAAASVASSRHLCGLDHARRGESLTLHVSFPLEPGAMYVVGMSSGFLPGLRIYDGRTIPLNLDPILAMSLTNPGIFSGFLGVLDASGEAKAAVAIPDLPILEDKRIFAAAITLSGGQIRSISEPIGITIR